MTHKTHKSTKKEGDEVERWRDTPRLHQLMTSGCQFNRVFWLETKLKQVYSSRYKTFHINALKKK